MKNKIILIVVIILIVGLVGGASLVMKSQSDKDNFGPIDEKENLNGDYINKIQEIEDVKIEYVTDETFENEVLKSEKTVLVDFYADWCGPCKVLEPIIQEYANENPDVKVVKLNVDENRIITEEYGVYSIPTLVVIKNEVETNRRIGLISKEEIKKLVEFVKE